MRRNTSISPRYWDPDVATHPLYVVAFKGLKTLYRLRYEEK